MNGQILACWPVSTWLWQIVCRSSTPIEMAVKEKISMFCHVNPEQVSAALVGGHFCRCWCLASLKFLHYFSWRLWKLWEILIHAATASLPWSEQSETPDSLARSRISLHHHSLSYRDKTRWAFELNSHTSRERTPWSWLIVYLSCLSRTLTAFTVISPLYLLQRHFAQTACYTDIHTITAEYISGLGSVHCYRNCTVIWAQVLCPAGLSTWVSESFFFFLSFSYLSLVCSKA